MVFVKPAIVSPHPPCTSDSFSPDSYSSSHLLKLLLPNESFILISPLLSLNTIMPLTEKLKRHGRKFSNKVLGPRNPDNLNLENLFFDPNINLPTTCPSTNNSSACSSFESVSSHSRLLPGNKPAHKIGVDEERGFPPPIPTQNPNQLRHRRRDTSPSRQLPECLQYSLARSATDPSAIDCDQTFLPPIPNRSSSPSQLKCLGQSPACTAQQHFPNKELVVSTLAIEIEQTFYTPRRGPTFQSHQHFQTSPARIGQDSSRDIGRLARRSASVSKLFHSNQFNETQYSSPAQLPQHRTPQVDTQDPSQHYRRLLASSIFDTSADSSLFSLRLEQLTQVTWDQPMNPSEPKSMAAMRASTFLDPNSARASRLPESLIWARNEAKREEAVIHAKLKSAGEPIPPYEFINFIGKGSYGRVYLA